MTWHSKNGPRLPAPLRHSIRGTNHIDTLCPGISVLMHRRVRLERWFLRSAANAFWRLYWPLSPGGFITFQGTDSELLPGSLYLISPHTAFDSRCSRPFEKWYLHFNADGLLETSRTGIVKLTPTTRMHSLLQIACPTHTQSKEAQSADHDPLCSLELSLLTLRMALPELRPSNSDARLARSVAYLQENIRHKITLKDLTKIAGVSSRTLSHLFVSELGFPPLSYLIELRLNRAMKLLRQTNLGIDQIAEECGFPNRYYFTRMFTKYKKITPARFRKSGGADK